MRSKELGVQVEVGQPEATQCGQEIKDGFADVVAVVAAHVQRLQNGQPQDGCDAVGQSSVRYIHGLKTGCVTEDGIFLRGAQSVNRCREVEELQLRRNGIGDVSIIIAMRDVIATSVLSQETPSGLQGEDRLLLQLQDLQRFHLQREQHSHPITRDAVFGQIDVFKAVQERSGVPRENGPVFDELDVGVSQTDVLHANIVHVLQNVPVHND